MASRRTGSNSLPMNGRHFHQTILSCKPCQVRGQDIGIFTPHNIRMASTSAAMRQSVPLHTILRTAGLIVSYIGLSISYAGLIRRYYALRSRVSMTDYWKEFSTPSASVVEMMLDRGGEKLASLEEPEILSYLPDFTGKRVIELGAGIGRYTSTFAESAYSVFAIDFMNEFIEKNKTVNNHYRNIEFQCGDVTKLQRDNRSADLVFSNWLLMYLSDTEVLELLQKVLEWLDDDGYLFIRESCMGRSGVLVKNNRNQIVWLLQKVKRDNGCNKTLIEDLASQETYQHLVDGYQRVFNSTIFGGVLDIREKYRCKVIGVTASITERRHAEKNTKENAMGPDQVKLEFADLLKRNYPNESFHAIYSRDSICTIADKMTLFGNFFKWLKPGGKVLISDHCSSTDDHSDVFRKYVKQRGYTLYSPVQYGKSLEEAGFVDVRVEDKTKVFTEALTTELNQIHESRTGFIGDFHQTDSDDIIGGWKDTLHLTVEGEQRWGIICASKPICPLT
ncbi:uncharacterized protein [Haliotis asinina]|uniref:uncharacterized protein n=1 Tax=Haliotis asinina TaxID=109174 RepID=UPI003531D831